VQARAVMTGGRLNVSGGTLIIDKLKKNDSGTYICVEDSGTGTEHYVRLTVHGNFKRLFLS